MREVLKKSSLRYDGIYRGLVVDNEDPQQLGRIKVKVHPMMYNVEVMGGTGEVKEALPWAVPAYPLFAGAGEDFGFFTIPEIDSEVWCFFENGDFMQPVYFAEAPTKVHGMISERTEEYPRSKVWKTKEGHIFHVNDKKISIQHKDGHRFDMDENVLKVSHKSGAIIEINEDEEGKGRIKITAPDGYIDVMTPVMEITDGNLEVGTAATGVFTSAEGRTITVIEGIVVGIT